MSDPDWWLRERTFHHSQFSDIRELVKLKQEQGITISVCLPTLNEAKSIGRVIKVLKRGLLERYHLLDEIGIVDSGSVDGTREIARRLGVSVYLADDCLPELPAYRGKGENLWKSLYLFKGDIIVWVDADIRNIHPRFVYGLLGPLLRDRDVGYVKSFYRRPLRVGHRTVPGGGRVTELMVRPFLNLLFPDLTVLAQPLSGEYAGRRSILEGVPFFTGYGVETGLLIDIEHRFGIRSIAQVDMDVRVHRNQSIESLRRMSYVILSVLMRRSEQLGKLALFEGLGHELHYVRRQAEGYSFDVEEIRGRERPPMVSIPEYRKLYGILEDDAAVLHPATETPFIGSCVSTLIEAKHVSLSLAAHTRDRAIEELLKLLGVTEDLSKVDTLLDGIVLREERLSTNVGHGVAIPHLMTDLVDDITIAVGRSPEGIDFYSSLVHRPVNIVVLVLSPPTKRDAYLSVLSCLARLFRHRKVVQDLMEVGSATEAVGLLKKYEALVTLQRQLRFRPLL